MARDTKSENSGGLLYLYNGGEQPEIWSVSSLEQAIRYAANFRDNRFEMPGKPPMKLPTKPERSADDEVVSTAHDRAGLTEASFYDLWHAKSSGGRDVGAYMPSGYIKG